MTTQDHIKNNLRIRALTNALAACTNPEEQSTIQEIITELQAAPLPQQAFISKTQVAKSFNIDLRTLKNRLWATGAIGEITDSSEAMASWNRMKLLSPLQVEIVYAHLGYPPSKMVSQ